MKRGSNAGDGVEHLVDSAKLSLLRAIAEAKSYSGAAAALQISQPAVSKQVKRLEAQVGRKLFRRTYRGVELTPAGEAVVLYARTLQSCTEELRRELRKTGASIKISIGISEDLCRTALSTVLALFIRDYPDIEIGVVSGTYDILSTAIKSRRVDFALMRRYEFFPNTTLLWQDTLVWVGLPVWPSPVPDPVPLVLPFAPNPARDAPLAALRNAGRAWVVRFEGSGIAGVEAAMQAGMGFCAAPRSMKLYEGVAQIEHSLRLPELPDVEFVMVGPDPSSSQVIQALAHVFQMAAISNFEQTLATAL